MTTGQHANNVHVLAVSAIKAAIETLQSRRIHEQFPAYLHLRQRALAAGSFSDIEPVWREVGELLWMPGGPPTKPHYRPFSSRNLRDPSGYWFNENLAGSYAPASVRSTSRFMLNEAGNGFDLRPDHAQQAFTILLKGTRVPAWALACYYLRNYGFDLPDGGGYGDLIAAFKHEFRFDQGNDFDVLFDDDPPLTIDKWFEPLGPERTKESEDA